MNKETEAYLKDRARADKVLKKLTSKKSKVAKDVIKIFPEERTSQGLLLCPYCGETDCLRKQHHEWYCARTKRYFNVKSRKWL